MSASGGPAADNELRAKIKDTINEAKESWEAMHHEGNAPAGFIAAKLWPLIEADRDARYQAGRNDAAEAIEVKANCLWAGDNRDRGESRSWYDAAAAARGEG